MTMATYYPIPTEEFEAAMSEWGFEEIEPAGRERVFARAHRRDGYSILCYSSLSVDGATARGCGSDAIRVVAGYTLTGDRAAALCKARGRALRDPLLITVAKLKRVHRVLGWRDNLLVRLRQGWRAISATRDCNRCGAPTVERIGGGRAFLGCTTYPLCRGSAPLDDDQT
jgi:hypothetical protein